MMISCKYLFDKTEFKNKVISCTKCLKMPKKCNFAVFSSQTDLHGQEMFKNV